MGRHRWASALLTAGLLAGCALPAENRHPDQPPAQQPAPATTATNGISCTLTQNGAAQQVADRLTAEGPSDNYLASDTLAWASYDEMTGASCSYRGDQLFESASVIKVATVATALWQSEQGRLDWNDDLDAWAQAAITISDNDAEEALWASIGGGTGLQEFLAAVGMQQTKPSIGDDWGLTTTTANDQLLLLRLLTTRRLLNTQNSDYLIGLMRQVDPEQAWGISAGAPADAVIALKNGWLDDLIDDTETEDSPPATWTHNSIGQVSSPTANYSIAVLSDLNATDEQGRERVSSLAAMLAAALSHQAS